jgi:hypothetical protein
MLLFTAAALAVGIFVHAQTIVHSLQETVEAKAQLFVGSDVQAVIRPDVELPHFDFPTTVSSRLLDAGEVSPSGSTVDLVAIDPDAIGDVSYWNPQFGAPTLEGVAREIEDDGGPLRVALVNSDIEQITGFSYEGQQVPAQVVARLSAFPGISSQQSLIVADADALARLYGGASNSPAQDASASTELWAKGDTQSIAAFLNALPDPPYSVLTVDQVKDVPSIAAVIDTFGVLNVLGVAAGLLVVVVLMMYLQARQRARVVPYALSRRMGLTNASHRWALIGEVGLLLLGAAIAGTIVAIIAAKVTVGLVDPLANIPPTPLFTAPITPALVGLVALVIVSLVGGAATNMRARRADVAEVMRVAE